MGTDSAPHDIKNKEHECGCAGVFNTIYSIQTLAQFFDNNNKLEYLENFISKNGALHYEVSPNVQKITLQKQKEPINFPNALNIKNQKIKIFKPNFDVFWNIVNLKNNYEHIQPLFFLFVQLSMLQCNAYAYM